jgi:hypothetical protein
VGKPPTAPSQSGHLFWDLGQAGTVKLGDWQLDQQTKPTGWLPHREKGEAITESNFGKWPGPLPRLHPAEQSPSWPCDRN